mgnify:CR=1 FL=1|jgi:hypothetical protein|tara:strand:+ start:88 stop:198 length:111 start_codon:yes stop_codon:yes gene_type:complete
MKNKSFEKKEKLNEALRKNLKRRKQQIKKNKLNHNK